MHVNFWKLIIFALEDLLFSSSKWRLYINLLCERGSAKFSLYNFVIFLKQVTLENYVQKQNKGNGQSNNLEAIWTMKFSITNILIWKYSDWNKQYDIMLNVFFCICKVIIIEQCIFLNALKSLQIKNKLNAFNFLKQILWMRDMMLQIWIEGRATGRIERTCRSS